MELRDARSSDAAGIRHVAQESLSASYEAVLGEDAIDKVVEAEYTDDRLAALASDPSATLVVAADDDVVGFAQGHLVEGDPVLGDIDWLHVHPDARGNDVGVRLLGEVVDRLDEESAAIVRGHVIEANEDGAAFYEAHGFERRSSDAIEIGGQSHEEALYERHLDDTAAEAVVEAVAGPEGNAEMYVDFTGSERGTKAPFYPVYTDQSLGDRWGWRCSNCESMATAMDSSGRIACNECDNSRAATRWDGAYL